MSLSLAEVYNAPAGQVRYELPAADAAPRVEEELIIPTDVEDQGQPVVGQPVALDLEKDPTPGVARFNVMDDGSECFTVKRYGPDGSRLGKIEEEEARRAPPIALADIAREGGHTPKQVMTIMRKWSARNPLSHWCAELLKAGVRSIIVNDVSGYEIPWEMLVIETPPSGANRYLGAAMAVSRASCGEATVEDVVTAPRAAASASAPILTYISAEMAVEETGAGSLESLRVEPSETLEAFVGSLVADSGRYGLVYMACHGRHSDSIFEVYLGSLEDGGSRLLLSDLSDELVGKQLHAPVFINACHSARLFKDREIYEVEGFPAEFVERGAPGVVGTAGEVSSKYAASFARDFLQDAADHPDLPIPELLRRRRERVAQRHADGELEPGELVSAFMYVYYGQPDCTIWIERTQ
jgi:CHAT domain